MNESSDGYADRLVKRQARAALIVLALLGLAFVVLPGSSLLPLPSNWISLTELMRNIGYGLIGGALTAAVFQWIAGDTAETQQRRLEQSLKVMQLGSNVLAEASQLGIVALAGERSRSTLAEGETLVQRWKTFLRDARHVDLLCLEDSKLLSFDVLLGTPGLGDSVISRLEKKELTLRILLSTEDNPALEMIDRWINVDGYMRNHVDEAQRCLNSSGITAKHPETLRRHREMLAFTLVRGDNELYIMYFFPRHGAGPVFQIARYSVGRTTGLNLFNDYQSYFETLWNECGSTLTAPSTPTAPAEVRRDP